MGESRRHLLMIPALFVVVFGTATVLRHCLLASWTYDLGIKSQVLHNCVAGRWLESSFEVQHYFGDHVNPTFLLLVPVYALWPSPVTLILVQCVCVAIGGVIIGSLSRRWLPQRPRAAMIAQAVYLLHPSTGNMVLYDFHENALAGTLILAAVLTLEHKRWTAAFCMGLLAMGCKENGGLAVAGLGTWLMLRHRRHALGLLILMVGLAYSYVAIAYVLPHFRGEVSDTVARYAHLGSSPADIVANLLRRPHLFVLAVLQPSKILYVLVLLLPSLFVPFLRPAWLLPAVWVLLPNLLSARWQQYSSLYQYDALVVPFVVLAMMRAWCDLVERGAEHIFTRLVPQMTIVALLLCSLNSRLWFWAGEAMANVGRVEDFARWVDQIPADAPLSASLNLGPHLIRRELLDYPKLDWPTERFPDLPVRRAEYVLVDYAFEKRHRGTPRQPQEDLLLEHGYVPLSEANDFALYQLKGAGRVATGDGSD